MWALCRRWAPCTGATCSWQLRCGNRLRPAQRWLLHLFVHCRALPTQSKRTCDATIASIFVNPTQFAAHEDLESYPALRPEVRAADLDLLRQAGVDAVYIPEDPWEVYPTWPPFKSYVVPEGGSAANEGAARPHFFRGVATVVTKLFNIVSPTHAFFGAKDAYQCIVVKALVRDLNMSRPRHIVVVPTQRAEDGLPDSSRNVYLTAPQRAAAPMLYRMLAGLQSALEDAPRGGNGMPSVSLLHDSLLPAAHAALQNCLRQHHPDVTASLEYLSLMDAASGLDVTPTCAETWQNEAALERSAALWGFSCSAQPAAGERWEVPLHRAMDTSKPPPGLERVHSSCSATPSRAFVSRSHHEAVLPAPLVLSAALAFQPSKGQGGFVRVLDNVMVGGALQCLGGP